MIVGLALSLAGAATGCSTGTDSVSSSTEVGAMGFNLVLPDGSEISSIHYEITGTTTVSGDIPSSGGGTTFTVKIENLKPGAHHIELSATQPNGAKDCFGSADFTVVAGVTTPVTVRLHCPGVKPTTDTGSIEIDGELNICAVVDMAAANPTGAGVYDVTSSGLDYEGGSLTYAWTASSGTFADASAANTTYTCAGAGSATLTLEVSDGDCGDKTELTVTCDGSGGTGGTGGDMMTGGTGGDMMTGGTGGDMMTGGTGGGDDACRMCESAHPVCGPRLTTCEGLTGMIGSQTKGEVCQEVVACVRESKCAAASGTYNAVDCYCGTGADFDACATGAVPATGACKDVIAKGAETTVVADIGARFVDPEYSVGAAFQLLQCDSRICPDVCDF